jgi:hypothetical protein
MRALLNDSGEISARAYQEVLTSRRDVARASKDCFWFKGEIRIGRLPVRFANRLTGSGIGPGVGRVNSQALVAERVATAESHPGPVQEREKNQRYRSVSGPHRLFLPKTHCGRYWKRLTHTFAKRESCSPAPLPPRTRKSFRYGPNPAPPKYIPLTARRLSTRFLEPRCRKCGTVRSSQIGVRFVTTGSSSSWRIACHIA